MRRALRSHSVRGAAEEVVNTMETKCTLIQELMEQSVTCMKLSMIV